MLISTAMKEKMTGSSYFNVIIKSAINIYSYFLQGKRTTCNKRRKISNESHLVAIICSSKNAWFFKPNMQNIQSMSLEFQESKSYFKSHPFVGSCIFVFYFHFITIGRDKTLDRYATLWVVVVHRTHTSEMKRAIPWNETTISIPVLKRFDGVQKHMLVEISSSSLSSRNLLFNFFCSKDSAILDHKKVQITILLSTFKMLQQLFSSLVTKWPKVQWMAYKTSPW